MEHNERTSRFWREHRAHATTRRVQAVDGFVDYSLAHRMPVTPT
jgi:hypothetical protein